MSLNLIMGARNGAKTKRDDNDFYATNPEAIKLFLERISKDKDFKLHSNIWECACGQGHISETLKKYNYNVNSTDLINRGYGTPYTDFLKIEKSMLAPFEKSCDILTNPPFKHALNFIYKSIELLSEGYYSCFFLKLNFLESKNRKILFENYPPKFIYIYSSRQQCALNANFEEYNARTHPYCWIIWQKGFKDETITRWI